MALTQATGSVIANTTIDLNNLTTNAQYTGFKNRIINGGMVIDQRNSGAAVTINAASNTYVIDRFFGYGQASDGIYTLQRSATAPAGFANSVVATVTTIDNALGASQAYFVSQSIEGLNVADLAWGTASAATVTLSFWVRSSVTGTYGGAITNAGTARSYPFTYTINSANTFEYKTLTIAGDTAGTWGMGTGIGLQIIWGLGVGSTLSGTAGAWAGAQYDSATSVTNLMATNGATWYLTGVQLEKGSVATGFDYRPYGKELMLCQRYYQQLASGGDFTSFSSGQCNNSTEAFFYNQLFVPMRSSPSITPSSVSSFKIYSGATNVTVSSFVNRVGGAVSGGNYTTINFDCTVASGLTASYGATLMNATSSLPYISFSSEL